MKIFYKILFVIFCVSIVYFSFIKKEKPLNVNEISKVSLSGKTLSTEVVSTDESRALGLSGRVSLGEYSSMLFVFDKSGFYPFWMKDMKFPIDIIWLDENQKIVYIKERAAPESYPQSFVSNVKAKYVLEVVSGFSAKNNLKVGDYIEFAK